MVTSNALKTLSTQKVINLIKQAGLGYSIGSGSGYFAVKSDGGQVRVPYSAGSSYRDSLLRQTAALDGYETLLTACLEAGLFVKVDASTGSSGEFYACHFVVSVTPFAEAGQTFVQIREAAARAFTAARRFQMEKTRYRIQDSIKQHQLEIAKLEAEVASLDARERAL